MNILQIFKKKKSVSTEVTSSGSGLADLPPISQYNSDNELISSQDSSTSSVQNSVSDSPSSKKLSAVEAFAQHLPKDPLPEDDSHYNTEEIACVDLESKKNTSLQSNKEESSDSNTSIVLPSSHSLPENDPFYDTQEVACIPSKKDLVQNTTKSILEKKEVSSSTSDEANQISHLKKEVLKQAPLQNEKPTQNSISEPTPKPVPNVFIKNDQSISFDDLPSFSDEELADETPEMMSLPTNPKLENVSEIFIEKHKYATMITSWCKEIDSLKKKTQAEKSFDHYDTKLQSLCTKANLSFARMQKVFAQSEKILLKN